MFHPLPLFVGLRYVRARSHRFFVSFITWVSLAGVALGVGALIVILSVMNGFEGELRERLLSLSAAVHVGPANRALRADYESLLPRLQGLPGVKSVVAYSELQVLAVHDPEMLPLTLRGIDLRGSEALRDVAHLMSEGRPEVLREEESALVIGRIVADRLGLSVGDPVTVLVPVVGSSGVPDGRLREFRVGGIFEAGLQDHDATLAFASLPLLQSLGSQSSGDSGLRLGVDDPMQAPALALRVAALAGPAFAVRDWTQEHASYFRAIRIEKTMMAIILLLIVAVAAFNIVAMLVMVVTEKRTDIAILRTFGAGPGRVAAIFLTQGLVIGWVGVIAGVVLGCVLALHVGTIVPALEHTLGIHIMDPDVYYITQIPSDLHVRDVGLVAGLALLLTLAATVYPALRAARTPPAEALRYE
jgi:lipoprotein-releasing system permease protein